MSLRICHITSMHPWFDDRVYERAARGQARAGHEVTMIAEYEREETRAGVRIIPLKARNGWRRRVLSSWEAWREARRVEADVYHFHDPDLIPWMLCLRTERRAVVYDIHEYYPSRLQDARLPRWLKSLLLPVWRGIDGWLARRFDGLVFVSESLSELYTRRGTHGIVVHNSVDMERLALVFTDPPKESRPVIYTSGTNSPARNCMQSVEALPRLIREFPDVLMRFVGRYRPEGYDAGLRARAAELGVAEHLELQEMYPWEENFNRTARAHIGCVFYADTANNRIGLPNRLFEYMFCGVALLAEDFPEVRRIVTDADCGVLVDSSKPESIAEGALELLRNPARLQEMAVNGRRAIREKYNFGLELKKMDDFYRSLLAG